MKTGARDYLVFGIGTCVLVIVAHAIAYMTHEYSHSFVAWALGWMANPFALDYGPPTLGNILLLGDVSDNVNYDPIFASGNGIAASAIALSGLVIGNVVPYFILYRISKMPPVAASRVGISGVYWLALMCAGNVWSYVPIRALTNHGDIALSAKGFGVSAGVQFAVLIIPALYVGWHFFVKMCRRCLAEMAGDSGAKLAFIVALTALWFFAYYGAAGASGSYGPVSKGFSIASQYFLFPACALWLWLHYRAQALSRR